MLNSIIDDYHQSKKKGGTNPANSAVQQNGLEFNPIAENDTLSMLQKLPDLDRIIFNLYIVEGYSHEEIAQILGIDVSESALLLKSTRLSLGHCIRINTKNVPQ